LLLISDNPPLIAFSLLDSIYINYFHRLVISRALWTVCKLTRVFVFVCPTVRERERDRGTDQYIAHLFIPVVINYSSFIFIVTRDQFLNRSASITSPVLEIWMLFGSSDVRIWFCDHWYKAVIGNGRSCGRTQWRTQEFFRGGGFNKFSWGQRGRGSGDGSPL